MRFENFQEMIERERPAEVSSALVAKVRPKPWVLRAGHGKDARIRMVIGGKHRYERSQGETSWRRVEVPASDIDVLDAA